MTSSPPDQSALKIQRGADWSVYWPVFNPDGSPMDISTWSAVAQIRAWYGAADLLFSWPDDADVECTSAGRVVLHVGAAQSTSWTFDRGVFGVELIAPSGDRTLLAQGPVLVTPEVVV